MMKEVVLPISGDEDDSLEDETELSLPTERWAPIGAAGDDVNSMKQDNDDPPNVCNSSSTNSNDRLRELEEEQNQLNSSLLALTTHFAQVQFRLKQIGEADAVDKENLLKELEQFAFKGCPDVMEVKRRRSWHSNSVDESPIDHRDVMDEQRAKQMQLIGQLKDQLQDLEQFAYEAGEGGLPSNEVLEKQKTVLDKLREKIDLDLRLDEMSSDELHKHVDAAIKQLINPMKMKAQLVEQLQTQITDLERFVDFLQTEGSAGSMPKLKCCCDSDTVNCLVHRTTKGTEVARNNRSTVRQLHAYLLGHFGCSTEKFQKNQLKLSIKGNHWGDLRAHLELAVDFLLSMVKKHNSAMSEMKPQPLKAYDSDEDELDDVFEKCHEEIVTAVRKQFCPALRDLLQHGLQDQVYKWAQLIVAFFIYQCCKS